LEPPEVVLGAPVLREGLHRRQLHALRLICDGLPFGPARGRDTRTQVLEVRLGDVDRERPELGRDRHVGLLSAWFGDATNMRFVDQPSLLFSSATSQPWKPLVSCQVSFLTPGPGALDDPDRLVIKPDPASKSGRAVRTIGWSYGKPDHRCDHP